MWKTTIEPSAKPANKNLKHKQTIYVLEKLEDLLIYLVELNLIEILP